MRVWIRLIASLAGRSWQEASRPIVKLGPATLMALPLDLPTSMTSRTCGSAARGAGAANRAAISFKLGAEGFEGAAGAAGAGASGTSGHGPERAWSVSGW